MPLHGCSPSGKFRIGTASTENVSPSYEWGHRNLLPSLPKRDERCRWNVFDNWPQGRGITGGNSGLWLWNCDVKRTKPWPRYKMGV